MSYQPISDEQYKARNVWPVGWYGCTVNKTEQRTSQAGNVYFRANVTIYNDQGQQRTVFANIMTSGEAAWQLRNVAEAAGLLERYKAGQLQPSDLDGKSCYAKVAIEIDKDGVYDDKNVIREYRMELPKKVAEAKGQSSSAKMSDIIDDEVPFD